MKLIKRLLLVVLILALLLAGFVLGQENPAATVFSFGFFSLPAMPLGVLVAIALLAGCAFGLLLAKAQELRLRLRIGGLKRQLARAKEIHNKAAQATPSTMSGKALASRSG